MIFDIKQVNHVFFPSFISPNIEVEAKQDDSVAGQLDLSRDSYNSEPDKNSSSAIVVAKTKFAW